MTERTVRRFEAYRTALHGTRDGDGAMSPSITLRMNHALPAEHRERLVRIAREARFPQDARVFEEGGHADRFWIVREGTVALEMHVPGISPPVVETLGVGDLVGWSWLFEPFVWQLGARTVTAVHAYELDAVAVRLMCENEPEFLCWVNADLMRRGRLGDSTCCERVRYIKAVYSGKVGKYVGKRLA